jgi:SAM-dependent methyltransferase
MLATNAHMPAAKFDEYAQSYDHLHNRNLAASGEPLEYFSAYKRECLERLGASADGPVLDFGCGIGNVTQALVDGFHEVHGYDPSSESLKVAQTRVPQARFHDDITRVPDAHFSSAVVSGVLHHIPRAERLPALAQVRSKLKPDGRLFVFEHNPLNPLTRQAVRMCPFDDDADLLWPWQAKTLLKTAGFRDVRLDFIVFFTRQLARLRPLEPSLRWLPLGAQMLVVGHR